MERKLFGLTALLGLLLYISCGGADGGGNLSPLSVSLNFSSQNCCEECSFSLKQEDGSPRQGIEDIVSITISGQCGDEIIEETFDVSELPIQLRVFFPLGECSLTAIGRDAEGNIICQGGATIDVGAGENNSVTLQCVVVEGEICDDGIDNDGDEEVDCSDSDCEGSTCSTGSGSGTCEDGGCIPQNTPTPTPTTTFSPTPLPSIENCTNGIDDDNDDATDCDDLDCIAQPVCSEIGPECSDGVDNDGDNRIDCADTDCIGQTGPSCEICQFSETICDDSADNDGDGLQDCDDPSCNEQSCFVFEGEGFDICIQGHCGPQQSPSPEDCFNGIDDDGDQDVDCDDCDDCGGFETCCEACGC